MEYCYGKLTVGEIIDRLLEELPEGKNRETVSEYVVNMLQNFAKKKIVIFSRI